MPELPEVETIKEALKKSIEGETILKVIVKNRRFREIVPDDFEKIISGTKILKVFRFAKYVIIELDNDYSIIWHFGMSGKIKFIKSVTESIDRHDHIIILTTNDILVFNDIRRFGLITYTKTSKLMQHHLFNNMGIDPFDRNLTADYLLEKFKNKKLAIKTTLLDQTIINGIGNIYASEALYKARISPLRESCSLSYAEVQTLIESVRTTLKKAIAAGGSTLRDYRKPDGSTGYFQNLHCVYNKEGKHCPDCTCNKKTTIKKITQNGRSTFYCEHLQK